MEVLLGYSAELFSFFFTLNDSKWVSEKINMLAFGLSSDCFELCFMHVIFFSADFLFIYLCFCRECSHVPDGNRTINNVNMPLCVLTVSVYLRSKK